MAGVTTPLPPEWTAEARAMFSQRQQEARAKFEERRRKQFSKIAARRVKIDGKVVKVAENVPIIEGILTAAQTAVFNLAVQHAEVLAHTLRNAVRQRLAAQLGRVEVKIAPSRKGYLKPDEGEEYKPFNHLPLQPFTLAEKRELGQDERILIATGEYLNSIRVVKRVRMRAKENVVSYVVYVPKTIHGRKGWRGEPPRPTLPLRTIGLIHEFGSMRAGIPPRPHWRPVIEEIKQRFRHVPLDASKKLSAALAATIGKEVPGTVEFLKALKKHMTIGGS